MKLILLLITLLLPTWALADFVLDKVDINCAGNIGCAEKEKRFQGLPGNYRSLVHLKETVKVLASDGGYQTFSYTIEEISKKYILKLDFKLKPIIKEINIGFTDRTLEYDPSQLVSLKEGDYFEAQKLDENLQVMTKRLEAMGYPSNTHSFEVIERSTGLGINIAITLGKPRIFKSITADTRSTFVKEFLVRKFFNLYNKPFELTKFKTSLDEAQKELFNYGYFLIGLDFIPRYKEDRVILDIKVSEDSLYAFDFKNVNKEFRDVLHGILVELFRKYKRPLTVNNVRTTLKDHYKKKALLNAKVTVELSEFLNKYNETVHLYRIDLDEKYKTRVSNVRFSGNNYFDQEKLHKMYNKEAFELASIKYFDSEYFSYFHDYLKTEYIKKGFVQVRIQGPNIIYEDGKKSAQIEYNIQEGTRAMVRKVRFEGIPFEFEDSLLQSISNKSGAHFNPIAMNEDLKKVTNKLQEEGYYYAEIQNINDKDIVTYSKSGADVDILYKINLGPLVRLNRVLFIGNDKTHKSVLWKKIPLQPGDIVTPLRTRDIESAISATGLFNSVSVTPLKHTSTSERTDLLIKVVERDYGLIEVAPGFRTDLGIKLTATASYLNIGGKNRSVSLTSQLNQRLTFRTIDPERRDDAVPILEHNTFLTYTQGDIFNSKVDLGASAGYQLKRFYAFDAEIARANVTLTRDLTKNLSSSVRYQLEDITQMNATNELDNGNFRIGALTPSLTYDFRNSQINPVSGAFFNLSCEFANPFFLSQKEPDLTINYYKLIARNRFYVPYRNGTLAFSLVGGMQENLARGEFVNSSGQTVPSGYIPNIKVFRLTGVDIVRGFTDEELNVLPDGTDLSDVVVDNKAYLVNLKVEPRYFINDNLMAGIFYDAGRVFVDRVNLGELRDSVGVSFKILTPVGTLDFDYGIKLLRETMPNGKLESPGRFHVSIGFF